MKFKLLLIALLSLSVAVAQDIECQDAIEPGPNCEEVTVECDNAPCGEVTRSTPIETEKVLTSQLENKEKIAKIKEKTQELQEDVKGLKELMAQPNISPQKMTQYKTALANANVQIKENISTGGKLQVESKKFQTEAAALKVKNAKRN